MANKQLTRQTIHDPRPIDQVVLKEDYDKMYLDEYPVAEILLPDNMDMQVIDGVLKIMIDTNGSQAVHSNCLFDKPLFDVLKYIDSFGIQAKLMKARHGLYPSIFLSDISSSVFTSIQADSQPFDISQIMAGNCFYAKNMITDIDRKVVFAQEQFGDSMLDCKYINTSGQDVFTDKHYLDGVVSLLVRVRVKRFYLCVKTSKYLPFHKVQESCFNESSQVRKAAIAYNAKVRNANK